MKKSGKPSKVFMIAATVILLALSAAALVAERYLSEQREKQKSEMTPMPEAVITRENFADMLADGLKAGDNLANDPAVTITEGTAYVRFNVELSDSDGVLFSEKLAEKMSEIEQYKSLLNPDSPSYLSFCETYHQLLNDYATLYAKGLLAFQLIFRGGENGSADGEYTSDELSTLIESGEISRLADEASTLDGDTPFVQLYSDDDPFSRQYVYKKALSAGESCTLFTNIIVPADWEDEQTQIALYEEDEDENFNLKDTDVNNTAIIGDGFALHISAEIVDTSGFSNPIAAFETAECLSAVTEIASDSEGSSEAAE